jgi:uncharacterized secreted protein with C-terminal beta-propeller domain
MSHTNNAICTGDYVAKFTAISLIAILIAGCSSGSSSTDPQVNTDYSFIKQLPPSSDPLVAGNESNLAQLLKNGMRTQIVKSNSVSLAGGSASTAPATSETFSGTTVQVEGVDEGDLVKYDGRYIYALSNLASPITIAPATPLLMAPLIMPVRNETLLKISRTTPATAAVEPVAELKLSGQQRFAPTLYRVSDASLAAGSTRELAVVSQQYPDFVIQAPGGQMPSGLAGTSIVPNIYPYPAGERVSVELINVGSPSTPQSVWSMELTGALRASRQIGNTLYMVTAYRPWLEGLIQLPKNASEQQSNEQLIANSTLNDLLPSYSVAGLKRPLVSANNCLLPSAIAPEHAYDSLLVVFALDLVSREIVDSTCLNADANIVYVSTQSLYVAGNAISMISSDQSVLHKFSLANNKIQYRGVGVVAGRPDTSYFLDEYQDDLRIITTRFDATTGPVHQLTVLREAAGQRLTAVATLPNSSRTDRIGKPGERIYAVRFFGSRAYIITFRQTDPLYVIDLSLPADPRIAGELQVPGFGTYLKPLGNSAMEQNYLWSIGRQADSNGALQGVKVELFDVTNTSQPRSVGSKIFGSRGSYSTALHDPHALTFLTLPGTVARYRLALPINISDSTTYNALHLLEVSGIESGMPQLRFVDDIRSQNYAIDRSVMHNDAVYYLHGDTTIGKLWPSMSIN